MRTTHGIVVGTSMRPIGSRGFQTVGRYGRNLPLGAYTHTNGWSSVHGHGLTNSPGGLNKIIFKLEKLSGGHEITESLGEQTWLLDSSAPGVFFCDEEM